MDSLELHKDKTLYVGIDENDFATKELARKGYHVATYFPKRVYPVDLMRRLHTKLGYPYTRVWYGDWKKNITDYDTVILLDAEWTPEAVRYINGLDQKIRVIVWYWNSISNSVSLDKFDNCKCEFWSFDENDCREHQLHYNTQFYSKGLVKGAKEPEYDVLFVGKDKGRLEELLSLESQMRALGVITNFYIVANKDRQINKSEHYQKRVSYDTIVDMITKSRAIMDILTDNQKGLTLRPLEALFFSKKLITNNKGIKLKDFYHPDNIFILEEDDIAELPTFLNKPLHQFPSEIMDKYDLEQWFARFFK